MGTQAASLAQLAVHAKVIPLAQAQRLREVVQAHAKAGMPLSMGRLLLKGGLSSKSLRSLLRMGAFLDAVRCDGCDAAHPQADMPDRQEYSCPECGVLLLGFRAFRWAKRSNAVVRTDRFPTVIPVPRLLAATPRAGTDDDDSPEAFGNPDGTTIHFEEVLSSEDEDNSDVGYIYVLPSGTGLPLSEDETLEAMGRLAQDVEHPPLRRNADMQDLSSDGNSAQAQLSYECLGGFALIRELGRGAAGRVFLARQLETDRLVALKVLRSEALANKELATRFEREGRLANLVAHENIVEVVAAGTDETHGVRYLALEYLDGGSLYDLLKKTEQLSETRAFEITRGVCAGLQAAVIRGVIHRDIKPENILFDSEGAPKLADLGLAKMVDSESQITETGFVVGTPCYIAPEQAIGDADVDIRVDIFALGFCLWQMLTGMVPFSDRKNLALLELIVRHIEEDLPDPRLYAPKLSDAAAQIVRGMTARNRDQRYLSPTHVLRDIDLLQAGATPLGANNTALPTHLVTARDVLRRRSGLSPAVSVSAETKPVLEATQDVPPPQAAPRTAGTWLAVAGVVAVAVSALGVWAGLWLHHLWKAS